MGVFGRHRMLQVFAVPNLGSRCRQWHIHVLSSRCPACILPYGEIMSLGFLPPTLRHLCSRQGVAASCVYSDGQAREHLSLSEARLIAERTSALTLHRARGTAAHLVMKDTVMGDTQTTRPQPIVDELFASRSGMGTRGANNRFTAKVNCLQITTWPKSFFFQYSGAQLPSSIQVEHILMYRLHSWSVFCPRRRLQIGSRSARHSSVLLISTALKRSRHGIPIRRSKRRPNVCLARSPNESWRTLWRRTPSFNLEAPTTAWTSYGCPKRSRGTPLS